MENNERDFLQEAQKEIASLKERIASLEERLAAFEAHVGEPEEASEVDFSDVELGVTDALPEPVPQPVTVPAFARGADVSWLSEMEGDKKTFKK